MMNRDYFVDLTKETLFAPRNAASRILGLNLPSQSLWMILVLMTVLNAIAYSASLYLSPPADPATMAMVPPIFRSPLLFSMALGGALVLTVFALTWIGQSMGGSARLVDILALMTWLQVLRFALQLVVAVLMLVAPFLGGSSCWSPRSGDWSFWSSSSTARMALQICSRQQVFSSLPSLPSWSGCR
ncbi:Yip1 family protein [Roseovarius pelagicus]|uniref:YIP1 family protein n=1 Tax=Roseovarius pelagicus TaxID=2980108 RepID=A0ABY6DCJ0_9RHOB|nr:Yip1 family protein [Roseovarius pelagicus]UXX83846.1 YIP1 family protein [Roseovarius pelagicus]